MKTFFSEFKTFITRGNVMDLAVGVIVGSAFTAIVTALTTYILKPIINYIIWLLVGDAEASAYTMLHAVFDSDGLLDLDNSIYIDWGSFIAAILNFLLVALVLFIIVRAFNKAKNQSKEQKEKAEAKKVLIARAKQIKKKEGIPYKAALAKAEKLIAEEKKAKEEAEKNKPAPVKAPTTEELLTQIRDLLKETKTTKQ